MTANVIGRVVGRFQSLMNAGVRIPAFIESLTGISNAMVAAAPPAAEVMAEAARFVGDAPMAAHNASFDRRFWLAELQRLGRHGGGGGSATPAAANAPFACTMLLARRLYPDAPSHRLGALAQLHHLPSAGRAHRRQRTQVEFVHRDLCARGQSPNAGGRLLALGGVADCQHHLRAAGREHPCGVIAEAGVGAGDDRQSAALVGNVFLSPSHA